MRKHILVYNKDDNEILMEFKSAREMVRYFKIDGKVARTAIVKGEYEDFLLIYKDVSNRKVIYVFDSNTYKLQQEFNSITKALKYAKVNFYTLKTLLENGHSHKGKIYSYKNKL
uniref:Nuclease-associated modular DNA-binding 1 domain-containing protein n=1 Tax=Beauveria lii TaxID=1290591 RepID=A0A7S6PVW7_9HYPO|nr:hypothetical protein J2C28_mgp08 [Beauveria lii]QOU11089.1 hypothetical protein [Beauveria lii]